MKKRILIALGVVVVIAAVAVGLLLSHTIMFFKHGVVMGGAQEVTLQIEPEELGKLEQLSSLKKANLSATGGFDQINAWGEAHPDIEVTCTAVLPSDVPVDKGAQVADLTGYSPDAAVQLAQQTLKYATDIKAVKIDSSKWTAEQMSAFREACPNIALRGDSQIGPLNVQLDASEVDLSSASPQELAEFAPFASGMANLKTVNIGDEEGHAKLAGASAIKQANPNATVNYTFTSFGKRFNINDTTLDFRQVPMNDNGAEVRELMASMPWVTYLDMDQCGIDDETMAGIRNDFPNTEVVWRVWFGPGYTCRTDETRIFASNESLGSLSPENDQALKYCNKVKYLDLGHNSDLQDIWFVSYMPDLEVFICILGGITDISPLADCPHLEFLEIFSNSVSDLSPLANCHELKHLNCCNNPGISDISCLYDIDLERFWCGYPNSVPQEQFDQYQALHPNCTLRTSVSNPHEDYRGDNPRYLLLREQIGYDGLRFSTPENDPLYAPIDETSSSSATSTTTDTTTTGTTATEDSASTATATPTTTTTGSGETSSKGAGVTISETGMPVISI